MMKLFILRPAQATPDPARSSGVRYGEGMQRWDWDCTYGYVVRAADEDEARRLAQFASENSVSDEVESWDRRDGVGRVTLDTWLDPSQTRCDELTADGPPGVVMRDYHSG